MSRSVILKLIFDSDISLTGTTSLDLFSCEDLSRGDASGRSTPRLPQDSHPFRQDYSSRVTVAGKTCSQPIDVRLANIRLCHSKPKRGHGVYRASLNADILGEPNPGYKETRPVALKWAVGNDACRKLAKEYKFYKRHLSAIQEPVAPKCFGLFVGESGKDDFACMILEWCGTFAPGRSVRRPGQHEKERLKMLAICALHRAGIEHGQITQIRSHHFILEYTGAEYNPFRYRIVGFAKARVHSCVGAYPLVESINSGQGCQELCSLEASITKNVSTQWIPEDTSDDALVYIPIINVPGNDLGANRKSDMNGSVAWLADLLAYYVPTITAVIQCLRS